MSRYAPALPTPLSQMSLVLTPPPPMHFGRGAVDQVGVLVAELGATIALVVTDPFLAASDITRRVRASLETNGVRVRVFDGVTPNPTTSCVDDGSDLAAEAGAEAIVALGGGSSMDAAKGIALGAVNPQRGTDLDYLTEFESPALPIVAVPTTAGTGAEANAFGVISDVAARRKFYVGHRSALARAAVLDPELTVGLPPRATAATGMDALTHAIESFLSVRANPYSDGLAVQVVGMVAEHLPRAVRDGGDLEARSQLLLASHIAGVGFAHTGLGLVHGIAHPLGGRFDLAHGLALSLVIDGVLRFNAPARRDRLARLLPALGMPATGDVAADADATLAAIAALVDEVGMSGRLRDHGITERDLPALAQDTVDDPVTVNNPVAPTRDDVLDILRSVL